VIRERLTSQKMESEKVRATEGPWMCRAAAPCSCARKGVIVSCERAGGEIHDLPWTLRFNPQEQPGQHLTVSKPAAVAIAMVMGSIMACCSAVFEPDRLC
jgi:hypothetical protein